MSDLLGLAARCEASVGPDRELDARIHCEVRGWQFTQEGNDFIAIVPGIIKTIENRLWIGQLDPTQIPRTYTSRTDALSPTYTASIDAAMTLVPEGCFWTAMNARDGKDKPIVGAGLAIVAAPDDLNAREPSGAATPALALCAAALRARAATDAPKGNQKGTGDE